MPGSCISCHILHFASRIASRIAYHLCIILLDPCTWLIVSLLLVCLVWVEPGDEYVIEDLVEYIYEDQANVNSENFAGKMTIPSKSLLSLLASCSLFCYAYATIPTTCLSCLPYCWTKPLTNLVLANRCLAMLPLLLSPSYSVASCRWSWSWFHVGTWIFWNIMISLI